MFGAGVRLILTSEPALSPRSVPLGLWLTLQMLMLVFAFQPLCVYAYLVLL